jgi:hypothetical protein
MTNYRHGYVTSQCIIILRPFANSCLSQNIPRVPGTSANTGFASFRNNYYEPLWYNTDFWHIQHRCASHRIASHRSSTRNIVLFEVAYVDPVTSFHFSPIVAFHCSSPLKCNTLRHPTRLCLNERIKRPQDRRQRK